MYICRYIKTNIKMKIETHEGIYRVLSWPSCGSDSTEGWPSAPLSPTSVHMHDIRVGFQGKGEWIQDSGSDMEEWADEQLKNKEKNEPQNGKNSNNFFIKESSSHKKYITGKQGIKGKMI